MKLYKLIRDVKTPTHTTHTETITTRLEGMRIKADYLGRDRWRNDNLCKLHIKPNVYWCRCEGWYSKTHLVLLDLPNK